MLLDQSKREQRQCDGVDVARVGSGAPTAPTSRTRVEGATIVATPVLRKIRADVTKFTPTAVKVKRTKQLTTAALAAAKNSKRVGREKLEDAAATTLTIVTEDPRMKAEFTDKAYENFMKEIEQLM